MTLRKKGPQVLHPNFNRDVSSLRAKLLRSASARAMIRYEVSLRGKWRESYMSMQYTVQAAVDLVFYQLQSSTESWQPSRLTSST